MLTYRKEERLSPPADAGGFRRDCSMSPRDWQERGIRIGDEILDSEESAEIVKELRRRVKDKAIIDEIEGFLSGEQEALSGRTRDALGLVVLGIQMHRSGRGR